MEGVHVDRAALVGIAARYEAAADLVESAVRTHLTALTFDGSVAGRAYRSRGDALRGVVDDVVVALGDWSRSATGIAAALRRTAEQYADADARAAARLR